MGIREMIKVLNEDKKMSLQEIADYVGVEKYVVNNWKQGKTKAKVENLMKVQCMYMVLEFYDIKYRGQALDILEEEATDIGEI